MSEEEDFGREPSADVPNRSLKAAMVAAMRKIRRQHQEWAASIAHPITFFRDRSTRSVRDILSYFGGVYLFSTALLMGGSKWVIHMLAAPPASADGLQAPQAGLLDSIMSNSTVTPPAPLLFIGPLSLVTYAVIQRVLLLLAWLLSGVALLFLLSGLVHLVARLLGEGRGGFRASLDAVAYASAPYVLMFVPVVGAVLWVASEQRIHVDSLGEPSLVGPGTFAAEGRIAISVLSAALLIGGMKRLHSMKISKAVATVLVTQVVLIGTELLFEEHLRRAIRVVVLLVSA